MTTFNPRAVGTATQPVYTHSTHNQKGKKKERVMAETCQLITTNR